MRYDVPLPPVAGEPGLTQGAYGDHGNLELVVPAVDAGIWVLWHNADPPGGIAPAAGPPPRRWSGALHFAGDLDRVDVARIAQVSHGPRFLEVSAVADGRAHRLYWTPTDGFLPGGLLADDARDVSAITELPDGRLACVVTTAAGHAVRLVAAVDRYPVLQWDRSPVLPGVRADATDGPDAPADAVTVARTTLDGGRRDAVLRRGDRLFHAWTSGPAADGRGGDLWTDPVEIRSCVEAPPGTPIHRRSPD